MREIDLFQRLIMRLLVLFGLPLLCPTAASAQNANDIISLFRGLAQTAVVQSALFEWRKLPKDELACIDRLLIGRGDSAQNLIQQGIRPTDQRISDVRASCVSQTVQQVAGGDGKSIYGVDGLQLGGRVQQGSSAYSQYQCSPSEQFSGFMWCIKKAKESGARGRFSSSYSILHSQGGVALYVNRYLEPAWFSGNEANDDVSRLSKKYGTPTRTIPMPRQSSVPNGMIVVWGGVVLEPLDQIDISQLAIGRDVHAGLMIDHIGNFQRSAQLGLPVYRLTGGAGFVWASSWDQRGTGTLRFLTVDASAITAQISNDGVNAESAVVADPEQVKQTLSNFTQDAREKARADALAAENGRLMEAQKAAAEEANRKRIADAESAKLTAQALDNSRRAGEEARVEALQAKRAGEVASENVRAQSQLYLTISAGVIIVLIIALVLLAFSKWRNQPVSHVERETGAVPNSTIAKNISEPEIGPEGVPSLDSFARTPPNRSRTYVATQPPVWNVRWWWLVFAVAFPGLIGSRDGRRMMAWQTTERRRSRSHPLTEQGNAFQEPGIVDRTSEPPFSSVPLSDQTTFSGDKREASSHAPSLYESAQSSSVSPTKISTFASSLSSGLNAVLVLLTIGGGLPVLIFYIFMDASGPNLKTWTQEVYLDPTATQPVLVLNIQSRDKNPMVVTGVSVNDDPKCFPEYASSGLKLNQPINDVAALNNLTNGIMQMMLKSKGINVLRDGYSRELKLGEIEKLSLGSPSFGGCTPVKVVIKTDHGSSTFNFK